MKLLDYTFSVVPSSRHKEIAMDAQGMRSMDVSQRISSLPGWPGASCVSSSEEIRSKLPKWRAASRDVARTADHAVKYLGLIENNVIGPNGVRVIPETRFADGTLNTELNAILSQLYEEQSRPEFWGVTGRLSRSMFSRLCARRVAIDGEALIRMHENADHFFVELVDAERLDRHINSDDTYMGVKEDAFGRPLGYWLLPRRYPFVRGVSRAEYVPADEIIHVFYEEEADQGRGVPWLATPSFRLKMLSGYEDAAVTAARGAAVKTGAYSQTEDAIDGARPAGFRDDETGRLSQYLSPGETEILPYGWKLDALDWGWPNIEHGAFVDSNLRGAAAGMQVDYYDLSGNLSGASYSSLRHAALTSREEWRKKQDWWISLVERRLYERRMKWLLATGGARYLIEPFLPPGISPDDPSLLAARYLGRRWPRVDPRHDLPMEVLAIDENLRAPSDVIRDRGDEPEEVWTQIREDRERMKMLDLVEGDDAK